MHAAIYNMFLSYIVQVLKQVDNKFIACLMRSSIESEGTQAGEVLINYFVRLIADNDD